jgi:hypothetical protein
MRSTPPLALAIAAALTALLLGCGTSDPRFCSVSCGDQGACPDGTTCGADGYCYLPDQTPGSCSSDRPDGDVPDDQDASVTGDPDARVAGDPDAGRERPDADVPDPPDAGCDGPVTFAGVNSQNLAIPDALSAGVDSVIRATDSGRCVVVGSVEIRVDITHTFRGDIRLLLTSPDGERVVVLMPSGDSDDDIHETFPVDIASGETAVGDWVLTVADIAQNDVGTLDRWSIGINRLAP